MGNREWEGIKKSEKYTGDIGVLKNCEKKIIMFLQKGLQPIKTGEDSKYENTHALHLKRGIIAN